MPAQYALVREGAFVEVRVMRQQEAEAVGHKLDTDGGKLIRPYEDPGFPDYPPGLEDCTTEIVVTPDRVEKVYTRVRKPFADQRNALRAEAQRRIYAVLPQWLQSNMTARAVEILKQQALNGSLTTEEQTELGGLQAMWAWVKTIQAASNEMELLDPIPDDYTSDAHWPPYPG